MSNQTAQAGHCAKLLFIFLLGLVALNIIALLFLPFIASGTLRYILEVVVLALALLEFATLILYARREQEQLRNLQEQNRRLTESDQFKERLLLMIDHELRTPLSAIKGYTEILQLFGHTLSQTAKADYLAQISAVSDEANLLVNSISDSLWLQGNQEILTQRVNLSELIQAVTSMLTPRLQQEQREIITSTETNLDVLVDPLRLRQVLTNLLTNAINYSPAGTPIEIRVTLQRPASAPASVASKAPQVYIGIHDQGIGIPPDQQARLFEPFVRLEAARALAARGTGLGLFLSRQLLTSMGGSIWIESAGTPGEGTTMWISVPLANEEE